MTTVVTFTSSESFLLSDIAAVERAEVVVEDYIEGTYEHLRSGPDGHTIACMREGAWELLDGRRFSDWAVGVA